jgi:glycosyltransferase involved in cell wall biosynthesis
MNAVVLVTATRPGDDAPDDAAAGHIRALERHVQQLVVVADPVRCETGDARDDAWGAHGWADEPVGELFAFEEVLREALGAALSQTGEAVLIVDGDLGRVERVSRIARERRVPLLWWRHGAASREPVTRAVEGLDGILTSDTDSRLDAAGIPWWVVGAGTDLSSFAPRRALPSRPPLRLLSFGGTAPDRRLTVVLRALARARGRGVDARLMIVGAFSTDAEREQRREVEALAADLALTRSVRFGGEVAAGDMPVLLREVHALIDAGTYLEPDRASLETMASARLVLSSAPGNTTLLECSPLPLRFERDDPDQLADRIAGLANAWADELTDAATALRAAVVERHSLERWAMRISAVLEDLRAEGGASPAAPLEADADRLSE